ncbi:MAG: glycosyltransferase family 2 protein [Phycisphaerae bacterium]|nr:glycosyltransferase family 2 protein [Phycisphaerae bacterium]
MNSSVGNLDVGVVVIGRNEGERLRQCLLSVVRPGRAVVYVDSGSSDGSVEMARAMNVDVVELPTTQGFTAARARNVGLQRLHTKSPDLQFVQFVDGDCVVDERWIDTARAAFEEFPKAAIVCGRRRERYPDRSVYNALCDLEWNTPIGEASECGGDAMMRILPIVAVGGFNPQLIAGEEPELCVRVRAAGWVIRRVDAEMTLHDANMLYFAQWWKRNLRAGHAFAEGSHLHGKTFDHWNRQTRSNWVWGLVMPTCMLIVAKATNGLSLAVMCGLYVTLMVKVYISGRRRGQDQQCAQRNALFCVLGKMPQMLGQTKFMLGRFRGRQATLIEYKSIEPAAN